MRTTIGGESKKMRIGRGGNRTRQAEHIEFRLGPSVDVWRDLVSRCFGPRHLLSELCQDRVDVVEGIVDFFSKLWKDYCQQRRM